LAELALFSQSFTKQKNRVNPAIGYKNGLPFW